MAGARVRLDNSALAAAVDAGVEALVGKALEAGAESARRLVPVDTGALQADITVEQDGASGTYGPRNVEYASFVEFGTGRGPEQPYLRPSIDAMKRVLNS